MTYYKKDGYVVDAKDQKKITIKEHCKNFNE
jgi:hypothetical protein